VKDLATTTEGAVVQPSSVLLTLVPQGEPLFADVMIRNEDIGFVQPGQSAQVKLAAFPFQKYGLLQGKVIHVSADATEQAAQQGSGGAAAQAIFKARIQLAQQHLNSPTTGQRLAAGAGMQITAEIHQGRRTVLEYLLSPVSKATQEAGRER
jgi:hemolysin D